jgi:DNA repair protein RadC
MTLDPDRLLAYDPPSRLVLRGPAATIAWARTVPDVGWEPETFALFLDSGHGLLAAWWLGADATLEDFDRDPLFLVVAGRSYAASSLVLVVCRPGRGTEPSPADTAVWDRLRAAHHDAGLPLLDVVLLDGHRWRSLGSLG